MYKIMLVDDDVPMLKYLKKMINWDEIELEVPTTTYSAVKALRLFMEELPDIVVMDIGIPQINGLELIEKFKEIKPEIRVIFLTCHENFDYAKRAVELNADEYLIKDELTAAQFEKSLKNAVKNYKKFQERRNYRKFQGVIHKNKEILQQNFLKQIKSGPIEEAYDISKMIGIYWKESDFIIGISAINYADLVERFKEKEFPLIMYGIVNVAEELAKDFEGMTILTNEEKQLHLIFNFKQTISRNVFDEYGKYLTKLQKNIYNYWKIDVAFLYSDEIIKQDQIGEKILKLNTADKNNFYREGLNHSLSDSPQINWNLNSDSLLESFGKKLIATFEARDIFSVEETITTLEIYCREKMIDPLQLIKNIVHWVGVMEISIEQVMIKDQFANHVKQSTRLCEVTTLLKKKIIKMINNSLELQESQVKHKESSRLKVIDQYILDHLSENVYSADMAKHLYLNPSYFSRYFKNLTGENFTDYVHSFKMEIAMKLIKENRESIKVIASHLGYSDRSYFSKIFKRYVGYNPGEFKTKQEQVVNM